MNNCLIEGNDSAIFKRSNPVNLLITGFENILISIDWNLTKRLLSFHLFENWLLQKGKEE